MADETPKTAKPAAKKTPAKPGAASAAPKASINAKAAAAKPKAKGAVADVAETAAKTLKDSAAKLGKEATGKARAYAEDGKARAGGVLDELSRMMSDAAGTVDDKVGAQYGHYARSAADAVSNFSESLKTKNIDDLVTDARDFARRSPAVAIGTAAALGFVLVRLLKSGLDADDRA